MREGHTPKGEKASWWLEGRGREKGALTLGSLRLVKDKGQNVHKEGQVGGQQDEEQHVGQGVHVVVKGWHLQQGQGVV